ncbi:MAG: hypothetical protein JXA75_01170 [Candidatus Thermoplasmatota archaeon]|nr:hypothetical protein [Candidatus Thermoplasmatota archaeon]
MKITRVFKKDAIKRECCECGRHLGIFEGYRHPTQAAQRLLCRNCFETIETSVERWGRFVLWNSFNPDAADPTFLDTFPFPKEDTRETDKQHKHHKHFPLTFFE